MGTASGWLSRPLLGLCAVTALGALAGSMLSGCGGDDPEQGHADNQGGGGGEDSGFEPCGEDEEIVEGQCRPVAASCELLDCQAQGRICQQASERSDGAGGAAARSAVCGRCDSDRGYVGTSGSCTLSEGACVAQGDCRDDQYCLKLDTSPNRPATCAAAPDCVKLEADGNTPARAWDPALQACIDCGACAGVTGATGKVWPVTASGSCVCETADGYYFDGSVAARLPRACDADGDGWVEHPARDALESSDTAIRANARCHVRSISHFTLQNERGERREVALSELGVGSASLGLFEPRGLDDATELEAAIERAPQYGERRFVPNELNPLTKACAAPRADFNQDGLFDIEQRQTQNPGAGDVWLLPFVQLAYFVELYRGYYLPGEGDDPGSYLIAERRRCDGDELALDYGDATPSSYWRSCERRRAGDFDGGAPWSDFGRFTCAAGLGSCPVADPFELFDEGDVDPLTFIPRHDSCAALPGPEFTGMNHSSQFRCVQFQDTASTDYGVALAQTYAPSEATPSSYVANVCGLAGGQAPIDGGDAVEAKLTCAFAPRSELSVGQVGWALAAFTPHETSDGYVRGCIGEGSDWGQLCPGQGGLGSRSLSNPFDFGNLYCGCGQNFGGAECDVACAPGDANSTQQHTGGSLAATLSDADRASFACDASGYCTNVICQPGDTDCTPGRNGYWMCASVAASAGELGNGSGWSMTSAQVPYSAIDRRGAMCDPTSANCSQGFSLR